MIELLIKSSEGEPHTVTVDDSDGRISIFCTCQAGALGQMCKHKASVIVGDPILLYDEVQLPLFNDASSLCQPTVRPLYDAMMVELNAIDAELTEAKKIAKKQSSVVRNAFARKLGDGIPT